MDIAFEGQTVVVTGVARGIGRTIARGFAERGAHVQALDILADGLAECERDVAAARGGSVTTHQLDLADAAAVTDTIRRIERQSSTGAIDVLVHAAGGIRGRTKAPIEDVSDDDWRAIMDANVTAAFHLARAAAPAMKAAGRGRFIAISSQAGIGVSLTGIQAYGTAKAAEIGFVKQLAAELGPFGITVNSAAPGFMPTSPDYVRQWEGYSPARQQQIVESIALRRIGKPEDIAHAVMFLASDYAGFITGQTLLVKGGP
jgi:3-oxoacyl-[acyl-carrier protein] reductase